MFGHATGRGLRSGAATHSTNAAWSAAEPLQEEATSPAAPPPLGPAYDLAVQKEAGSPGLGHFTPRLMAEALPSCARPAVISSPLLLAAPGAPAAAQVSCWDQLRVYLLFHGHQCQDQCLPNPCVQGRSILVRVFVFGSRLTYAFDRGGCGAGPCRACLQRSRREGGGVAPAPCIALVLAPLVTTLLPAAQDDVGSHRTCGGPTASSCVRGQPSTHPFMRCVRTAVLGSS